MQTNLTYITRVNLPSSAAQSKQILSMSKEFSKILGNNFHLISGVTISSKNDTFEYRELENDFNYKNEIKLFKKYLPVKLRQIKLSNYLLSLLFLFFNSNK